VPVLITLFDTAEPTIALRTVLGKAVGYFSRYNAAVPATCGVAMDVPLIVLVAETSVIHAEVIEEPGANKSKHVP